MTDPILVLRGRRGDAEPQTGETVVATIFAPEQSEHGDYFCRVSLPTLYEDEKRIAGVDAEQARELACIFARDLLAGFGFNITAEHAPGGS
ncbi:hypothetical protein [Pelagibius sp.]|uniref:DUF6968 family protein n=1 Tax=Pelagibius sp. TaxID=1931238 RepID=UPI00262851B5|nr:hypothetical protein [Pelagibius sp.]